MMNMQQPAGVASLSTPMMANRLAQMGRYDDDQIAHVAEGEMLVPAPILKYYPDVREEIFDVIRKEGMDPQEFIVGGDMVARNPYTGVQEFGFLSKVFKGIKKIVKKAAPIILGLAAAGLTGGLVNPFTTGGLSALGSNLAGALTTSIGSAATAGLVGGTVYGLARGKNLKDSLKRGAKVAAITGAAQGIGAFDPLKQYAPTASASSGVSSATTAQGANMSVDPSTVPQMSVKPEVASQSFAPSAQRTAELEAIQKGTQLASAPATFGEKIASGLSSLNPFSSAPGAETGFLAGMSPGAKTFATTATALTVLPILLPQDVEQYQQESGIPLTQEDIDALTGKADAGPPSPAAIAFAKFYRDRQNYQGAGGQQVGGSGIPTLMEGGEVAGPGTGTSDSIPALLSDGEFVMTAEAVRNAGGGNRRKGAAKMYKLMKNLEAA